MRIHKADVLNKRVNGALRSWSAGQAGITEGNGAQCETDDLMETECRAGVDIL